MAAGPWAASNRASRTTPMSASWLAQRLVRSAQGRLSFVADGHAPEEVSHLPILVSGEIVGTQHEGSRDLQRSVQFFRFQFEIRCATFDRQCSRRSLDREALGRCDSYDIVRLHGIAKIDRVRAVCAGEQGFVFGSFEIAESPQKPLSHLTGVTVGLHVQCRGDWPVAFCPAIG